MPKYELHRKSTGCDLIAPDGTVIKTFNLPISTGDYAVWEAIFDYILSSNPSRTEILSALAQAGSNEIELVDVR